MKHIIGFGYGAVVGLMGGTALGMALARVPVEPAPRAVPVNRAPAGEDPEPPLVIRRTTWPQPYRTGTPSR